MAGTMTTSQASRTIKFGTSADALTLRMTHNARTSSMMTLLSSKDTEETSRSESLTPTVHSGPGNAMGYAHQTPGSHTLQHGQRLEQTKFGTRHGYDSHQDKADQHNQHWSHQEHGTREQQHRKYVYHVARVPRFPFTGASRPP